MEWCSRYAICKWTEQHLRKDRSLEEKCIYATKWSCWEELYWRSDPSHKAVDKWYTTQRNHFEGCQYHHVALERRLKLWEEERIEDRIEDRSCSTKDKLYRKDWSHPIIAWQLLNFWWNLESWWAKATWQITCQMEFYHLQTRH